MSEIIVENLIITSLKTIGNKDLINNKVGIKWTDSLTMIIEETTLTIKKILHIEKTEMIKKVSKRKNIYLNMETTEIKEE